MIRFLLALILSFSWLFVLSGCPLLVPGELPHDFAMANIIYNEYSSEDDSVIFLYSSIEVIPGVISSIGHHNEFTQYDLTQVKEYFTMKKVIAADDIMLFFSFRDDHAPDSWYHLFIIKDRGAFTEVRLHKFAFYKENLANYPNSYYFFDWVPAIESECRVCGISAIVKQ